MDEFSDKLEIYEVKRQAKELDMNALRDKSEFFLQIAGDYKYYKINHIGLSIEDMK